ncbi:MAG: hypothetical protein JWM11_5096 [Planctomycetaceae bacterium]|nr:hypothetical protein [Planctomycetaceae bacterium]
MFYVKWLRTDQTTGASKSLPERLLKSSSTASLGETSPTANASSLSASNLMQYDDIASSRPEQCDLRVRRELADERLVFHVPDIQLAGKVAGNDSFAVVTENDAPRSVGETLEFGLLVAVGLPDAD